MKLTLRIDDKTVDVEIVDLNTQPIVVRIDGEPVEVFLEKTTQTQPTITASQPSSAAPTVAQPVSTNIPTAGSLNLSTIRAPIPGNIVAVHIKPGDSVSVGQELCVLEAMKMRNAIRSGRNGTIAAVHITVGTTVKHNDLLFEFTD